MVTEKYFQNLDVEGVSCELDVGDLAKEKRYQMVRVNGLTTEWAQKNKLTSGLTTLFSDNAQINDDTSELIFPPGDKIKVSFYHFIKQTVELSPFSSTNPSLLYVKTIVRS
jgi:hypothetical protein